MSHVSPGWYSDPASPPHAQPWLRWWDGATWTSHVAPVPAVPSATASAPAGPTSADGVPLAGWGWRALAYLLDGLIIAVPNTLATLPAQIDLQRKLQDLNRDLEISSRTGRP